MHHPTDRIAHTTAFVTPVVEHWLEQEIAQWVHPMNDRFDDPSHHERTLLPRSYIFYLMYPNDVSKLAEIDLIVLAYSYGSNIILAKPVLHDRCNKGRGMCYSVCGMMHIKEPLLLIIMSSLCGGSGFPLSLSEWSFTICLTPYNRK